MEREETVLDTFSPASKYEAMLLERGGVGLNEDKTLLVFQVLDQIIPHLGVFIQVMKSCRDELFEAVYSDQYTGSDKGSSEKRYIQKVPYFTLVKRIFGERDEQNVELSEHLDVVKKRLFDKQKQYEEACDKIELLESQANELRANVKNLEEHLEEKNNEVESLENCLEDERKTFERTQAQLKCDIQDLEADLQERKDQVAYLRNYKLGYDDLQAAFNDNPGLDEPFTPKRKKKAAVATKRANLISNIENAIKLEEQILTVQNCTIEEFDAFLEEHKGELAEKSAEEDHDDPSAAQEHEYEIEQADQQLLVVQERFKKNIDEMNTELSLLRQHRSMIQEQLQQLEESRPQHIRKKKSRRGSRPTTQESSISGDVDLNMLPNEDEDESQDRDPFIPQERVFAKYAAMLYTSDNQGKSFHEFKDAKYCASCGEKTVLCPHKILQQDHVFLLPSNSTHLKVARPKVRINLDTLDMFRPQTSKFSEMGLESISATWSPPTKHIKSRVSIATQHGGGGNVTKTPDSMPTDIYSVTTPVDTTHFTHSIERLWDDYKMRTPLDRLVPRPLSLPRTISLIEQFGAYLIWQDEVGSEYVFNILENVYQFMRERYIKPDVMYFAAHDFLNSLTEYHNSNKLIWIFTQVLIGNLDAATFRYILLMGDFIQLVEWKEVEDFRAFAQVVYPFLNEDDIDSLQMSYTSFSENKISRNLVAEFIVYNIIKYRESRFLEMENKLLNNPGKEAGLMTEAEFVDASDACLSLVNDSLRKKLYRESQVYVQEKDKLNDGVPVLRLAQMTSYLDLLQQVHVIKEQIRPRVLAARMRRDSDHANKTGHGQQTVADTYPLLNMTSVKNLAHNIAKRDKMRQERQQTEADYS